LFAVAGDADDAVMIVADVADVRRALPVSAGSAFVGVMTRSSAW
jgi:hypothetical protein